MTIALIKNLERRGIKSGAFKPLAGHSLWWQHESYLKSLKMGTLFGMDAYRLWTATGRAVPIEMINPADVLLSVPILSKRIIPPVPSSSFDWFVLGRFTECGEGIRHIIYWRAPTLPEVMDASELLRKIVRRASETFEIRSLEEYVELHKKYYFSSVESCYEAISNEFEEVVVESFNDSVYPWRGVEKADLVVVSAPPEIQIYSTQEFFAAIRSFGDPYIKTYSDIFEALRPIEVIRIRPVARPTAAKLLKAYSEAAKKIINYLHY